MLALSAFAVDLNIPGFANTHVVLTVELRRRRCQAVWTRERSICSLLWFVCFWLIQYFVFLVFDARNGVNSTRGELQRVVVKPGIQSCTGSVGVERFRVLALSALAVDLNIPGFANSQQSRNSINGLTVAVVVHTGCFLFLFLLLFIRVVFAVL